MRVFYKYAPLVFALFEMLVGLTSYYLDRYLQISLWGEIALLLCIGSFMTGRLVRRLDSSFHNDSATGLWNRRLRLTEERTRTTWEKIPICVARIDNFKLINDKYAAGDLVLSEPAAIFENTVRTTDIVARWGGDELIAAVDVPC